MLLISASASSLSTGSGVSPLSKRKEKMQPAEVSATGTFTSTCGASCWAQQEPVAWVVPFTQTVCLPSGAHSLAPSTEQGLSYCVPEGSGRHQGSSAIIGVLTFSRD